MSISPEYVGSSERLDEFGAALCSLIKPLLNEASIRPHSVTYRVKTYESASKKLSTSPGKYAGFADLTDMLGVRVITHFEDEVDLAADALVPEFEIDAENSVDKRKDLGSDRFGYVSLHHVAALTSARLALVEYRRFKGLRFELQIRSILQHAWAEIEHDLGYKTESAPPGQFKRRFSRLAGTLEFVDAEFTSLRDDHKTYSGELATQLTEAPESLHVDQFTVREFINSDEKLYELDRQVAAAFDVELYPESLQSLSTGIARDFALVGVERIDQIKSLLDQRFEYAAKFADMWANPVAGEISFEGDGFYRGIGLFYLQYTVLAQSNEETVRSWAQNVMNVRTDFLMKHIQATWERVVRELGEPPAWG